MIIGIGIDIVKISRIEQDLARFGEKFAHRLLTDTEMALWHQHGNSALFLAGRFAAKEAASKALGTGFNRGVSLKTIAIINNPAGRPELTFLDTALEYAAQLGCKHYHVSLSHEREFAVAMVVLEG